MSGSGLHATQIVFLVLLFAVVAFAALARKLRVPYPIILVIGGLILSFVPGMPKVTLNPDVIFFVVLPPLLYFSAWNTSWKEFRHNLVGIASLAIGLVAFTVFGVSAAGPLLFGFDWRIGFVLGAVVATTDAIAATSIAKRIGLPKQVVHLLEGESLVNDATGLLALDFATAIVVYGQTPTVLSGGLRLIYLAAAGIAVGLLLGPIVEWFELRIDDGPIEMAISILVPYASYLAAESIRASGVLAVVAAGLYLRRKSSHFFSPSVRLQANAVWNALDFILNGFVFITIGLQLRYILAEIHRFQLPTLLLYAGIFSAFLILLRLLWTYPSAFLSHLIRARFFHQTEKPLDRRQVFVVGWTGMRGVIALAAAISLPRVLADGSPFPHRNLIVFLTYSVILVTLVLQGLTLPPLIRALKLSGPPGFPKLQEARRLIAEAALKHIKEIRGNNGKSDLDDLYDDFANHYQDRLESLTPSNEEEDRAGRRHYAQYLKLSRNLLDFERQAAIRLRNEGRIDGEALRQLELEHDLTAVRLRVAADGM